MKRIEALGLLQLCFIVAGGAMAQPPPAGTSTPSAGTSPPPALRTTPQSEAGEPRADTSVAAPPAESPPAGRARADSKTAQKSGPKIDRLDLGTATVTGDREQPKVMYVVPWKRSDIGDLGKPMNSLVDEILAPIDRDVFKREVAYYHAAQAGTSQNGALPKPAQQGER